ncbi:MAG: iron-regulated protein [Leptolyngbya sp.]|nr:MAG: iron-regulated protein [Leptolyngbya sp.]
MTLQPVTFVSAFIASLFLFWLPGDRADALNLEAGLEPVIHRPNQTVKSAGVVLQDLAKAEVVYLAETHDRPEDHQAQLYILQKLHQLRPNLAIALEMFQRPYQPAIDRYLAGDSSEAELQSQTQYPKRWGYPWEFYAPILRFAKAQKLPVVALNTPTEITRKVSRTGLDSLTLAEKQWIPPKSAIRLGPEAYRQRIRQIYDEIHAGSGSSTNFEKFFLAQVLWDETMADRIASTLQKRPDRLIVVLVGQGHVLYGDGIPNRVARRAGTNGFLRRPLRQRSVLLNPTKKMQEERNIAIRETLAKLSTGLPSGIADYFWHTVSR